jgi:hypothetical protein
MIGRHYYIQQRMSVLIATKLCTFTPSRLHLSRIGLAALSSNMVVIGALGAGLFSTTFTVVVLNNLL